MLIHQIMNSLNSELFNTCLYRNLDYQTHLHRGYEFICVLDGTLSVTVNQKTYTLDKDDCVLITPYQLHSFACVGDCTFFIVVFSGSDVESFSKQIERKTLLEPLFTLPTATLDYIKEIFLGKEPVTTSKNHFMPPPGKLKKKAALYSVCAEVIERCAFSEKVSKDQLWILDALLYIEEHFAEDITLEHVAKMLGYSYEHLSREFNRMLGFSFKSIVNQYRCERARHLIETTDRSLTDIAGQSGFQSIRSFNRVFKEQMGMLPSELRKNAPREIYAKHSHKRKDHIFLIK